MAIQLTWDDLLIQNLAEQDWNRWLRCWSGLVSGKVSPLGMSKFGDWFLRHPDGSTSELSVLDGTYEKIAATAGEFSALLNLPEWQEEHLLSWHLLQLHERHIIPGQGECYAFAPHPLLTGKIEIDHVTVMPIGAWQTMCAQLMIGPGACSP